MNNIGHRNSADGGSPAPSVEQKGKIPDEYFDYLNAVTPKEIQPGG
jgi:hypothetical protein